MASLRNPICFGVLVLASLCASASVATTLQPPDQLFKQHMDRVSAHPCQDPQPHSLAVGEMMELKPHQRVTPTWTVLHRCHNTTGYCRYQTRGELCGMKTEENVTLVFRIKDMTNINAPDQMVSLEARNHTSCACQETMDIQNQ